MIILYIYCAQCTKCTRQLEIRINNEASQIAFVPSRSYRARAGRCSLDSGAKTSHSTESVCQVMSQMNIDRSILNCLLFSVLPLKMPDHKWAKRLLLIIILIKRGSQPRKSVIKSSDHVSQRVKRLTQCYDVILLQNTINLVFCLTFLRRTSCLAGARTYTRSPDKCRRKTNTRVCTS